MRIKTSQIYGHKKSKINVMYGLGAPRDLIFTVVAIRKCNNLGILHAVYLICTVISMMLALYAMIFWLTLLED